MLEADGNDEWNEIAEKVSPLLSDLNDGILLNDALFQRVKTVYDQRESLGLTPEQMRLLTETYKSFVNNGAQLNPEQKARLMEINKEPGSAEPEVRQQRGSRDQRLSVFREGRGPTEGSARERQSRRSRRGRGSRS